MLNGSHCENGVLANHFLPISFYRNRAKRYWWARKRKGTIESIQFHLRQQPTQSSLPELSDDALRNRSVVNYDCVQTESGKHINL